jgi:hypothetical protein
MTGSVEEEEKKQLWEVYQEVDDEGKKKMFVMANYFLNIQLVSEGEENLAQKRKKEFDKNGIE